MQSFISRLVALFLVIALCCIFFGKANSADQKYDADVLQPDSPAFKMHGWILYDVAIDAESREIVSKAIAPGYEKPFDDLQLCMVEQLKWPMIRSGDKLLGRVCGHDTTKDT